MENTCPHFYRGDIVDLIEAPLADNKKINNIRKALFCTKPYKLIILRPLDDNLYLVAVCKEASEKTQLDVGTNKEPLHVKLSEFFSIDAYSLRLCSDLWFKKNKSIVVEEIYTLHNALVEKRNEEQREKRRKEREVAQKKKAIKRQERDKQNKLEDQYKGLCTTLPAAMGMGGGYVPMVYENHGIDSRYTGPYDVSPTISARCGTGGNNLPLVDQPDETFCIVGNVIDRQPENGGNGCGYQRDLAYANRRV